MNLFEFPDATNEQLKELGFAGAGAMFAEGVEVQESALEILLEDLAQYMASLFHSGEMDQQTLLTLADKQQEIFVAIHRHAQLQTLTKTVQSVGELMEERGLGDDLEQGNREGA